MNKVAFIVSFAAVLAVFVFSLASCKSMSGDRELRDRLAIRELVDRYAVESDRGNQDYYRNIFWKDITLRQIANGNVFNEFHDVEDIVRVFKSAGATKISYHQTGQQVVNFSDASHATGTTYLIALLGNETATPIYIRYEDTFEKIGGRWWITARDQYFVYR